MGRKTYTRNYKRKDKIIMEENLKELIRLFYNDKQQLDQYKKSTEEYNKDIKNAMKELGYDKFETDDYVAKVTIQKRESFIDEKLIAKLKELNVTTPIKTIEVVDMDELENVIYNGQLDASELSSCKQVKEVVTLKVSERKDK
jgi:hypothetical protein